LGAQTNPVARERTLRRTPASAVLSFVRGLIVAEEVRRFTDRELLARFRSGRDEEAFAALVQRHGPMVLGVCRRFAQYEEDAEDCFQATFLALSHEAGTLRRLDSLASWLYGVAFRGSAKMRSTLRSGRAFSTSRLSPT
jgi:hypothetical protein